MSDDFDDLVPDEPVPVKQYFQKGDAPLIVQVKNKTPIFGYNFLSMNSTSECFNHKDLAHREFSTYFQKVKEMSSLTIQELLDDKQYHFHQIKYPALNTIIHKVKRHLKIEHSPEDELPVIAQFGLYTDEPVEKDGKLISKAPRVVFALSGSGILNILFLDVYHDIYKKEVPTKSKIYREFNKISNTVKGVKGITAMLKKSQKR